MLTKFKTWIFTRFPYFYKQFDTYKDANDQGLFERYISAFGEELDDEVVPLIDNVLDILDAQITPDRFLTHLSESLGSPPDVSITPAQYRNLLSYIVDFYKIKGTIQAYELFFYFMGFELTINEINPINVTYDNGNNYDSELVTDLLDLQYDMYCATCSYYTIDFSAVDPGNIALTPEIVDKLTLAIDFNEPINAILIDFTYGVTFNDLVTTCIEDEVTIQPVENRFYDTGVQADSGRPYDFEDILSTTIVNGQSPACPL